MLQRAGHAKQVGIQIIFADAITNLSIYTGGQVVFRDGFDRVLGLGWIPRQINRLRCHADFMDALMILLFLILPIVVYTLILSCVIYHSFRQVRHRFSG